MKTFREHFYRSSTIPGLESEGIQYGKPVEELEYTIYAELEDINCLNGAFKVEQQEQWRIPLDTESGLRTRIRAIDGRDWHLTLKQYSDEYAGCKENTMVITKEFFNMLKVAGCDGYQKTRYMFRCEGSDLVWEVDVFKSSTTGKPHMWVKLDLEVKSLDDEIPKPPFKVRNFVIERDGLKLSEKVRISNLWNKEWARLDNGEET